MTKPQDEDRRPGAVPAEFLRAGIAAVGFVAIVGCASGDPGERACSSLREWAASGDLAREVYAMSPEERREQLRSIADDAAASERETIRSAGFAVSAGMDDPGAAVLGVAQLANACGPGER
jgi:hypothetical protein